MPEGDTLHRTAHTLARVLEAQRLVRVRSSVPALAGAELAGHVVEKVWAQGKNLLIRFDDGRVLHTHLKMRGSWHVYRPGERFQRPEHQARVILEVADALAVCFAAPTVRLLTRGAEGHDAYLAGLGPDLIPAQFELERAVSGLEALAELELGEALMTQTALSGIGNVYKSETLFICRLNPFRAVSGFDRETLTAVVRCARELLQRNARPEVLRRNTTGGTRGAYWVYRRSGQPCRVCGNLIRMQRQGALHRSTYFCPNCQSSP